MNGFWVTRSIRVVSANYFKMKELNFNIKSWHSILWRSTWGDNLPDNICGYFWSLVGAILLAPLALVGHIINLCVKRFDIKAAWWSFYPVACLLVGFIIYGDKMTKNPHHYIWFIWLLGFLVSIGVVGISCIIELLVYLKKKYDEKRQKRTKPTKSKTKYLKVIRPNPLVEGFKAFKGKYCSKINWKDESAA